MLAMSVAAAVLLAPLPSGRLARDAAWHTAIADAWQACPLIGALPNRGAEVRCRPHTYSDASGTLLHGLVLDVPPAASEPQLMPGVVLFHTAAGPRDLYLLYRGAQLASQGYVVLNADLYGDPDGQGWEPAWSTAQREPFQDRRVLIARAKAALDALADVDGVDSARLGAWGYCLGGRAALDLARSGDARLKTAASFHGVLDALPSALVAPSIATRVQVFHGALDPFSPPPAVAACRAQLASRGCQVEYFEYADAKHGFTCAAQALNDQPAFDYDAAADHASFQAALRGLADL